MRRREFLANAAKATAVAALSPALRDWARGAGVVNASLAIKPQNRVSVIPADFTGLSYESAQLAYPPFFSQQNTGLIAFCRTLGKRGILRIGGNTSEFTRWTEQETAPAAPIIAGPDKGASKTKPITPITPAAIRSLAGFLDATDWKLLYGLNLGTGTPERAAVEAEYVQKTIGPRLVAFQIGNEPDLYGHSGLRPKTWNFDDYLAEWRQYVSAIRRRVPGARFAAPDVADRVDWVVSFAEKAAEEIVLLTHHYYAEGPPTNPEMNIDRLLRPNLRLESGLARIQKASRGSGLPFRLCETNSCYNGGKEGVSDTFASALWGGDLMFQIAQAGESGINFHGGDDGIYTPVAGTMQKGFLARPIYYGMLLFKQAVGGAFVESALKADSAKVTAYAVRMPENSVGLALINKDETQALRIRIDPGIPVKHAEMLRLTAPAVDSKSGVEFGGARVSSTGSWSPSNTETVGHGESAITVELSAASAAWIRIA